MTDIDLLFTWHVRRVHPFANTIVALPSIIAANYRPILHSYREAINQRRLAVWGISCYQSVLDGEAGHLSGPLPFSNASRLQIRQKDRQKDDESY